MDMETFWIIFGCISCFVAMFGSVLIIELVKRHKTKEYYKELTRRLPEVEYTEIVVSSNGSSGSFSTYNTFGGVGGGSYESSPKTKFLVVYKSGYKQVVSVEDKNPLFDKYVLLLKNKN